MRSKTSFVTGIVLIILGVVMILADYLGSYQCMCPGQITGQPNTCYCPPSAGYLGVLIFGIALAILGLIFVIIGILPQRYQSQKLESIQSENPISINAFRQRGLSPSCISLRALDFST